ncbi:MAG: hypothetical protein RJA70_4525 [Pseudomonadota bacterium]|jgi:hypothetical protein
MVFGPTHARLLAREVLKGRRMTTTAIQCALQSSHSGQRRAQLLIAEWACECPLARVVVGGDTVLIAQQPDEPMDALVERIATRLALLEQEGFELVSAQLFSGRERSAAARHWRALLARLLARTVHTNGSLSLGGSLLTTGEGLADTWALVQNLLSRVAAGVRIHVQFPDTGLTEPAQDWSLVAA